MTLNHLTGKSKKMNLFDRIRRKSESKSSIFGFSSTVHYDFDRHYGYGRSNYGLVGPYHAPVAIATAYGHPAVGLHVIKTLEIINLLDDNYWINFSKGYGSVHKHGFHHNNGVFSDFGYQHESRHGHHLNGLPVYPGYVPTYGYTPGIVDHSHGFAYGQDAIGHFDHFSGPFGPFGFYANFYHDKK